MATSLLILIDDIATVLDDVALMTKAATKKTAGVLGDDLALNAQQVAGVKPDRELPVVWAVAKGSLKNKVILVPAALAVSALAPWAITPALILGGAFLCFEGFEKLAHKLVHAKAEDTARHDRLLEALADPAIDIVAFEKNKVRGAVRTDFILSGEIIVITLGTVATASLATQVVVLSAIAIIVTVGVYALVAGIVKLDDGGLLLSLKQGKGLLKKIQRGLGRFVLQAAPYMMKGLSVAGTFAMFVVGGGILVHSVPGAKDLIHSAAQAAGAVPGIGPALEAATPTVMDSLAGFCAGAAVLSVVNGGGRVWSSIRSNPGAQES